MSFTSSWTCLSCPSLKMCLFSIITLRRSGEAALFFSDECLQSSAYSWISQFYQVTSNYYASHHLECHYANLHMAWTLCLDKYLSSLKALLGKEYHTFCSLLSFHMYHDLNRSHSWREGLWRKGLVPAEKFLSEFCKSKMKGKIVNKKKHHLDE